MNKNKKKIIIIISIIVAILIIAMLFLLKKKSDNYYVDKKESIAVKDDIMSSQKKTDEEIEKYINDKQYTMESPKIIENPYQISPLTALIIFQTKKETKIDVYINDDKFTTTESSKKHSIPIYGLIAGQKNVVKLVDESNNTKTYDFNTNDDPYKLVVDTSNGVKYDDFYFVAGPMGLGYAAFNGNGQIVWYTTSTTAQDLEFLSNGHILISNDETYGSANGYTGFYEIDFLGKVYKKYILENGFHHEVNELSDGNLIVAGMPLSAKIGTSYVSIIDKDTGKETKSLDLYEVLAKVDQSFADSLLGMNAINNSIDYNEETDNVILSIRGLNTIMSVNMTTKNINWMLANPEEYSQAFTKYILKSEDNSRLPKGQHTAFLSEEGYLGVFNNDFSVKNTATSLSAYKDSYSSATYYKIDTANMTYKTQWNYIDADHSFNYAMGSFIISPDNHKIVNFGWTFDKIAYENNLNIYEYDGVTYSRIVDLDENNNIIFRAALAESSYRVDKRKLYNENTPNFEVIEAKMIDTTPYTEVSEIKTSTIKEQLDSAIAEKYTIDITKTSVEINCLFDDMQEVKIYFVGDNNKTYLFNYKPKDQDVTRRINFNLKGKYAVYISVDDKFYETGNTIDFDL